MATLRNHFEKTIIHSPHWLARLYERRTAYVRTIPGGVIVSPIHGKPYGIAGYDPDDFEDEAARLGYTLRTVYCVDGWDAVDALVANVRS